MSLYDCAHGLDRLVEGAATPVAAKLRVKHVAQPVQDHLAGGLRQYPVINLEILIRISGHGRKRPTCHHDDAATQPFDEIELLLVRGNNVVDGSRRAGHEMIGSAA